MKDRGLTSPIAEPPRHWSVATHSVRRRFTIGVMLGAMAAIALTMSLLRYAELSPAASVYLAGLLVTVTVSQALFARRVGPRAASMLAGGVYNLALLFFVSVASGRGVNDVTVAALATFSVGLFVGYLAGAAVSSFFLVYDAIAQVVVGFHTTPRALSERDERNSSPLDD